METKRNIRKLPSFKEFINEAPQKMKGNAPFDEYPTNLGSISKTVMELNYQLLKQNFIHGLDLYKSTNYYYVLGVFEHSDTDKDRFIIINELSIEIEKFSSHQKQLNNKVVGRINTIHTHSEWQGRGISSALYNYIIDSGIILISDDTQYQGAVNLWKNFASVKNAVVYVYDILEDKIIKKYTQNTAESHVWSDNASKQRIRLVFTKLTKT